MTLNRYPSDSKGGSCNRHATALVSETSTLGEDRDRSGWEGVEREEAREEGKGE